MQAGQSQQDKAAATSAYLRFDAVSCKRGGRMLFTDLSLALGPGDAIRIAGPNGIGKSSLLRLAAGLLNPADGTVMRGAQVALVNEDPALDRNATVEHALECWRQIDGGSEDDMAAALEGMGCGHLAEISVRLLSTGQRKRVAIARAITGKAKLWLLDEPANGLDRAAVPLLEQAIATHRATGGAVLIASHIDIALPGASMIDLTAEPA